MHACSPLQHVCVFPQLPVCGIPYACMKCSNCLCVCVRHSTMWTLNRTTKSMHGWNMYRIVCGGYNVCIQLLQQISANENVFCHMCVCVRLCNQLLSDNQMQKSILLKWAAIVN